MPGFFYQPLDRRQFLRVSGQAAALFGLAVPTVVPSSAADAKSLHMALLSDTHIAADPKDENRQFLPTVNLKLTMVQVQQARPQAALINGDLARLTGELDDYAAVKGLLAPVAEKCPIYLGLGNHDHRENFAKTFTALPGAGEKVADKQVAIFEQPVLRLVVLDSLLYSNKTPGLLGKTQREWLDNYLARCDGRPTVLFVHHTLGDADGELLDADAFLRIVRPYRKVKAIFYGHSHEYSYKEDHGIHLINLPAVGYSFRDTEPVGWVDAFFGSDGVDLTLKAIGGSRAKDGQTTSLAWRSA
ncbi:MAG: metallophosphoesterase [Verrucomicrobiota bacterium]